MVRAKAQGASARRAAGHNWPAACAPHPDGIATEQTGAATASEAVFLDEV